MKEPKIRFKGFQGEWEAYCLNDICSRYDNLRVPIKESKRIPGDIPYYGANGIQDYVTGYTHDGEYILIAEDGASDLDHYPVQYINGKVWVNNHAHVLQGNPDFASTLFLKYAISCLDIKNILVGGSRSKLNSAALMGLNVNLTSIEEQRAIASYFQHLDSLIQSTTKKIESLKQVKAASLQSMFPQEGETTPRVRFKGFEGEWEKVRASNVFKTFNEKNRPNLPVLSATQDRGMVTREAIGYNIFHDKSNEATYKHILPGQFIIHLRSFQGGFAHSAIEGIASPAYTIMEFRNKTRHFDLYWKYIFMSKEFIKRLELITYGIRDGRSISFEEFSEMYFTVPSYEEQQKIASYFTTLDRQISLQTQRLEKLKQIKAACLDNMFV